MGRREVNFDVLNLLWEEVEDWYGVDDMEFDGVDAVVHDRKVYVNLCSPAFLSLRDNLTDENLTEFAKKVLDAEIGAWDYEFERAMRRYARVRQARIEQESRPPQPPPVRQPKPGTVYLITGEHGKHKIGRTTQLEQRLAALRSSSGLDLAVVRDFPVRDAYKTEAFLHEKFQDKRSQGEWFELTEDDVLWLQSLNIETLETLVHGELSYL